MPASQTALSGWPRYRVAGGRAFGAGANRSALAGYPGLTYYSSVMPAATSAALTALGMPWSGWGRAVDDLIDPGLDPLLGVGARLIRPSQPPTPLLSLRSRASPDSRASITG